MSASLVGSEMCIRDSSQARHTCVAWETFPSEIHARVCMRAPACARPPLPPMWTWLAPAGRTLGSWILGFLGSWVLGPRGPR
eukprot:8760774-Alexandrium_andersonii.AAC.1